VHAQVAAKDEAAFEVEQEVLADRLHALEAEAVELVGQPKDGRAGMRRLDSDDLALENAEALGRAVEGVAQMSGR